MVIKKYPYEKPVSPDTPGAGGTGVLQSTGHECKLKKIVQEKEAMSSASATTAPST